MRRFNQSQDQSIEPKSGIRSSYGANNLPRYQALSPMVSIGTVRPKPTPQIFHVASPMEYSLERPRQLASLQCKEVIDLVRPELAMYGIRNNARYTCRPNIGGMRGDSKGLASDPIYPVNNPLLQKTDSFFAYLQTPLKGRN
jgi:hypothetical protein